MLAISCNHGLCDSAHLVKIAEMLAKFCKGDGLPAAVYGLSRKEMTPENLAKLQPSYQQLLTRIKADLDVSSSILPPLVSRQRILSHKTNVCIMSLHSHWRCGSDIFHASPREGPLPIVKAGVYELSPLFCQTSWV